MKKIHILLIILVLISLKGLSQHQSFEFQYYGGAAADINGLSDIADFILPSGTELTLCDIVVYHPKTYYSSGQNVQHVTNINIYSSSSNFNETINYDAYGNVYTKLSLISNQTSDFIIQQDYSAETDVILTSGFTSNAPFPTNISSEYTMPTANIQSYNPGIASKAASLTNGCTTMQEAVEKIGRWVIGSLNYAASTDDNKDMDALSVFNRRTGNCAGYTNLAIALMRSVDIPARYVSGAKLYHEYSLPIPGFIPSSFPMGGSSGPHAVYEVEYPDKGWVIAEPQRTLNFMPTHFVRHHHGTDMCDKLATISYSIRPGDVPPILELGDMCGTITNFDNNYDFHDYSWYESKWPSKTVISVAPALATGINDKVEIVSATNEFKTGESVSYQATFTSGDGTTYPVNWGWEIILYHSGGDYTLVSDYNANNLWGAATEPLLPSYNWLIDPLGNIYGEVIVTVNISDGDFKTAKLPVSVEECTGLYLLNKTYTSNTTKQGCFVTLENVSVQNNAKLTVNSEMGVKIEKDFSMTAGTQLEIN
jgi:transglutaminase-like putative cysteine protease